MNHRCIGSCNMTWVSREGEWGKSSRGEFNLKYGFYVTCRDTVRRRWWQVWLTKLLVHLSPLRFSTCSEWHFLKSTAPLSIFVNHTNAYFYMDFIYSPKDFVSAKYIHFSVWALFHFSCSVFWLNGLVHRVEYWSPCIDNMNLWAAHWADRINMHACHTGPICTGFCILRKRSGSFSVFNRKLWINISLHLYTEK